MKKNLLLVFVALLVSFGGVSFANAESSTDSCNFLSRFLGICYDGFMEESQSSQAISSLKSSSNLSVKEVEKEKKAELLDFVENIPKDTKLCDDGEKYIDTKGVPCNRRGLSGNGSVTFAGNSAGFLNKEITYKVPKYVNSVEVQACAAGGGGGGGAPGFNAKFIEKEWSYEISGYVAQYTSGAEDPAGGGGGGATAGDCEYFTLDTSFGKNIKITIGSPGEGGGPGWGYTDNSACQVWSSNGFFEWPIGSMNPTYEWGECPLAVMGLNYYSGSSYYPGTIFPPDMPVFQEPDISNGIDDYFDVSDGPIKYSFYLEGGEDHMYQIPTSLVDPQIQLFTEEETIDFFTADYFNFLQEDYLENGSSNLYPVSQFFDEKISIGAQDGKDAAPISVTQTNFFNDAVYSYAIIEGGNGGKKGLMYNQKNNNQAGILGGFGGQGGKGTTWPWWHNGSTGEDDSLTEMSSAAYQDYIIGKAGYATGKTQVTKGGGRGGHGESLDSPLDGDSPTLVATPTGYSCPPEGSSIGGGGGWYYPEQGQWWSGGTNGCSAGTTAGGGGGGGGAPRWVSAQPTSVSGTMSGIVGGGLSTGYRNKGGSGGDGGEGFVTITW